jgi:hypothetical protein
VRLAIKLSVLFPYRQEFSHGDVATVRSMKHERDFDAESLVGVWYTDFVQRLDVRS